MRTKDGGPYEVQPVESGLVACRLKGHPVPAELCDHCVRGALVKSPTGDWALCPLDDDDARVSEIATLKPLAVTSSTPIESLILLLVEETVQAVPVVDEHRRVVGMASKSDLVLDDYDWAELRDEALAMQRYRRDPADFTGEPEPEREQDLYLEELLHSRTVGDIMSREPVTVHEAMRVVDAAKLMASRNVLGCPVVSSDGQLKGMVTALDIARWVGLKAK